MALPQHVGPDVDRLAGDALDRVTAAIDARKNILDEEAGAGRVLRRHFGKFWRAHPSVAGGSQRSCHDPPVSLEEGTAQITAAGTLWFHGTEAGNTGLGRG